MLLDFSNPQVGKGSCNRKVATIKGHMRLHLNKGHNIESAEDMVKAMSSRGGVPGVYVTLCAKVAVSRPFQGKIDGVSKLSNIAYEDGGMRVWKAYGIGPGKVLLDKPSCSTNQLLCLTTTNCTTQDVFEAIRSKNVKTATKTSSNDADDQDEDRSGKLFLEKGFVKSLQRHADLVYQLDCGEHTPELENETPR
jgi:hypothetical protein